ncbi:ATP-dependent DNA ligase [Pseudolysinimonas kribbensis]|uniref:ATP-dependent DNA ligase n=1 Tax=Pseudolysinimonas kribbensis TaxID=433641 RepID=UPI0031D4B1B9
MALPLHPPTEPMLATAVDAVPEPDAVEGGYDYEPKWDGFRGIVFADGADVEIGSRGSKSLTRYFPELVDVFAAQLGEGCVVDGEIVVRTGRPGAERLDWDSLSQRIHPAASRVAKLAEETPASFVAFDLLAADGRSLLDEPFAQRRARLETLFADVAPPLHLSRTTRDAALARRWFTEFEGAGLDGVVAKPRAAAYQPGKRVMRKVKHHRTADVVPVGYRVHKSGTGVGSLLVGLYDADGTLRGVGGASAFSTARRLELLHELEPLVERDAAGEPVRGEGERSRFSAAKDVGFVRLRPERVLEVRYDQLEGGRFRHAVQFERWRPDRDPASCRYDQLESPPAYDLDDALG